VSRKLSGGLILDDVNGTLTTKATLNELKLKLIYLGMDLEDPPYKKEQALQEVIQCIKMVEEIDETFKLYK
jgi:hypothetical protein